MYLNYLMFNYLKIVLLALIVLILASCTTAPSDQAALNQPLTWSARQAQLNAIEQWKIHGGIAIRESTHANVASVYWEQIGSEYQIDIFGPLGIGRSTLKGDANTVTLTNGGGQVFTAHSPEDLLKTQWGWFLPVSHLTYWIRGLPAPNVKKTFTLDKYHHLKTLNQEGWQISYKRYTETHGIDLPSDIHLRYHQLSVRIVVSEWDLE